MGAQQHKRGTKQNRTKQCFRQMVFVGLWREKMKMKKVVWF